MAQLKSKKNTNTNSRMKQPKSSKLLSTALGSYVSGGYSDELLSFKEIDSSWR